MKHVIAIVIKFLMIAVILEIILNLMTDLTFGEILTISLTVTVVAYLIGDLLILSKSNNTFSTLADAGLALFTIYMFNYWSDFGVISFVDALVSALFIGVGEWFFHMYLAKTVFPNRKEI